MADVGTGRSCLTFFISGDLIGDIAGGDFRALYFAIGFCGDPTVS